MNIRFLLLCALCLTACARRNLNNANAPTLPPPAVATNTVVVIQTEVPTTALELTATLEATLIASATQAMPPTLSPTLEPTATPIPPQPSATLLPQSDPLGDELEGLLGQLEATNSADEQDINNLPNP